MKDLLGSFSNKKLITVFKNMKYVGKWLWTILIITLAFQNSVYAENFCKGQPTAGDINWDIVDNGQVTVNFEFEVGDVATQMKNVQSVNIVGLHQFAGDIAAEIIPPGGAPQSTAASSNATYDPNKSVILFRLGDGTYGEGSSQCGLADFNLTISDSSGVMDLRTDLSQDDESNYCVTGVTSSPGYRDRTSEPIWAQPYLPNFPVLTGIPGLSGNPKTYESQGITLNKLSNLVGKDVLGTWGVYIEDAYAQDVGTLTDVCVDMDFGSVTYDIWVSKNPTCTDKKDNETFLHGETVYMCYEASNQATEDFTFQSETNNHGQTLSADLGGLYEDKFTGTTTQRVAYRSFLAGSAAAPVGTNILTGSITVQGSDTYFTAGETLTTAETVTVIVGPAPTITTTTPIEGDNVVNASEAGDVTVGGTSTNVETLQTVTVTITDGLGGFVTTTATIQPDGSWTAADVDVSSLADGPLTVAVSVANSVGSITTDSDSASLDATAPIVATTSAPTATVANEASYPVSGTCTIGDGDVTVGIAGATPATQDVTCTPAGTWAATFDVSGITDGTNVIDVDANQTDAAGNTGTATTVEANKDATAPIVATTSAPTATVANEASYPVSGTCTIGDGDVTVGIAGATPATQDVTCTPAGTWAATFDVSGITDGTNVIDVDANQTDAAGNTGTATTVEANKDATAPIVATTSAPTATVANEASYPVSGTCTIGDGDVTVGIAGATPATQDVTCTPAGTWAATFDVSGITDGTNVIDVDANQTDAAGNTGTATTVEANKDATAPIVATTSAPTATVANEASYPVSGTCTIGDGDVTVGIAGATPATQDVTCTPAGTWAATFDVSGITDGTNVIDVDANQTDAAGNTGTATTVEANKDATAPIVATTSAPTATVANEASYPVSGTCTIGDGDVTVGIAGATPATQDVTCTPAGTWAATFDVSGITDGTNVIDVDANQTDAAGNTGTATTVEANKDATAPIVATTSAPTATVANEASYPVSGTCTIGDGDVTVGIAGATPATQDVTCTPAGTWAATFDVSGITDGTNVIDVDANQTDAAGNTGTATTVEANKDATAPIVATTSAPTATVANEASYPVSGTCTIGDGDVTVGIAGATPATQDVTCTPAGTWAATFDVSGITDGTNVIDVDANQTDAAGNTGTATTVEANKDATAPIVATTSAPTATVANEASYPVSGTCTIGDGDVTVGIAGATPATQDVTCTPAGTWAATFDVSGITDGTNVIDVDANQTDAAGNTGTATTVEANKDATAPIVATTSAPTATVANEASYPVSGTCTIGDGDVTVGIAGATPATQDVTCTPAGTWAATFDVSGITDGTNVIDVDANQTDAAGNTGTATTVEANKDATAPIVATTSAPTATVANEASYPVSGTCTIGDGDVTVGIAGATPATQDVTCTPAGTWAATFDVSGITDGTNVIDVDANQTDAAGNTGTATTVEANKDATAPIVATTSAPTATVANEASYPVSGTCTIGDGDVTVGIAGATPATQDVTCTPAGTWAATFDVSGITDGTNVIDVDANQTDAAGNTGTATTVEANKDATAPIVATTSAPTATVANEASYPVSGTCTIGDGDVTVGIAGATPATQDVTCTPAGTWAATFDVSGITDGTNVIDVDANQTDAAGNTGTATTVEANKDATAPIVATTSAPTATVANEASYPVSGTCTIGDGDVTVGIAGATPATQDVTCTPAGTWAATFDVSGITDGTNVIDVDANQTDAAGNTGTATTVEANKDATAPIVATTSAPTATVANEASYPVSGTCTIGDGDVTVGIAGATPATQDVTCTPAGTWAATFDVSGITDGTNVIDVDANQTDGAGNTGTATTVEANKDATVVSAPTVLINDGGDELLSAAEIAAGVTATITLPADAAAGDILGVDTNNDGIADQNITLTAGDITTGSVDITVPPADVPANGLVTVNATLTDPAGNTSLPGTDTSATDSTFPSAPTVLINDGGDELLSAAEIAAGVTATITLPADAAAGDILGVDTNNDGIADQNITLTAGDITTGSVDITVPPADVPANGLVTVNATLTDPAGNTSLPGTDTSATDSTFPSAPTVLINDGGDELLSAAEIAAGVTATITLPADAAAGDILGVDTNNDGIADQNITLTAGDITTGSVDITVPPADVPANGLVTVNATLTDPAGNTSLPGTDTSATDSTFPSAPTVLINDGGDELLSAAEIAAGVTATITLPADAAAGDILGVDTNNDGIADQNITLTAGDITTGSVDITVPPADVPANGLVTVNATLTDPAGNTSLPGTDTSATDSTFPSAPTVLINDGGDELLSAAEIAAGVTATITLPADAAAGDILGVDTNNDGIADQNITLTAGDITTGSVDITVPPADVPANGLVTVNATLTDPAGNTSLPGTDTSATDSTFPSAPTVLINDGGDELLSAAEIAAGVTATITLPADAAAGDILGVDTNNDGIADQNITLTAGDITTGSVDITVPPADVPANGLVTVNATLTDPAGNTSLPGTDTSATDSTFPSAPTVLINDGGDELLSAAEIAAGVTATITLPADAAAGDILGVDTNNDGIADQNITLTAGDITTGSVDITVPPADVPANGLVTVNATLTDPAGNTSLPGTDTSATDSTPPALFITGPIAEDDILNATEVGIPLEINGTTIGVEDGQIVTVTLGGVDYPATVTGGTYSVIVPPADLVNLPEGDNPITANVTDAAGNPSPEATNPLLVDTTAPEAPIVTINDGGDELLDPDEITAGVTATIGLPINAEVNDTLEIDTDNDGIADITMLLSAADISLGSVTVPVPAEDIPDYGNILTVTATVTDIAGNTGSPASDTTQVGLDTDGDGIPNIYDIDDDNDGIPDVVEENGDPARDTDGDGIIDSLDLDSDNDGILDIIEAGGADLNNDGMVDAATDSDNDGLADVVDVNPATPDAPTTPAEGASATTLPTTDTDGDGTPDFQDVDSDNDGISDLVEGGTDPVLDGNNDGMIDNPVDPATGIATGVTPSSEPDTDSDGIPDYKDLDSDNDGLNDVEEAGATDTDGDGAVDTPNTLTDGTTLPDVDGNGTPDVQEPNNPELPAAVDANGDGIIDDTTDTDGDGIPDVLDGSNGFTDGPMTDTDGDGIPDVYDIDDDNDGIPDVVEEIGDPARDTDGDGIPDSKDLDSDNDGITDLAEAIGACDGTSNDTMVKQAGNQPMQKVSIAQMLDADCDGVLDDTTDSDNDGLADIVDANPDTADNPSSLTDGLSTTKLPLQDTDGDGKRDFQDVDSDNDGISDLLEAGADPLLDENNDGMIDGSVDSNGIVTGVVTSRAPDTDQDGVPDYRDLDSDNDGLPDVIEAGAPDTDGNGIVDTAGTLVDSSALADENGDGIADALEPNNPYLPVTLDADGDGIIDNPTDTDGDGIPDVMDGTDGFSSEIGLSTAGDHATITDFGGTAIPVLDNDNNEVNISSISFTQPEHGTISIDDGGTPDDPSDDQFIYEPDVDHNNIIETFTYTIVDAAGNTSTATVTLDVQCTSSQRSDGGDALGMVSMFMMMFLTAMTGLYFVRREEERGEA